jgi:VWFA-related protein
MKKFFFVFIIAFSLLNPNVQVLSQTQERKKPKIKKFGSSLKRQTESNSNQKKSNQADVTDEDVIKINTNLVVSDCLVTDLKGNIITGLKADDFNIFEDNQLQEIQSFSLGNDARVPRSIVLIIDYSPSQKPYIERSVAAAKLLVDKLRPNDLMAIVTDNVEIISQFTADKNNLKKKLDSLIKNGFFSTNFGESKQFSALYAVLNEMFDETDVRPIVIFQTDGDELLFLNDQFGDLIYPAMTLKKTTFSSGELFDLIDKSRASIYSIFVGAKLLGLSEEAKQKKREIERLRRYQYWGVNPNEISQLTTEEKKMERQRQERIKQYYPNGVIDAQEFMSDLSQKTGGWLEFLEEPEQAEGIYTRILSELNVRYLIGYYPSNDIKDGKRRILKIEVKNHPEYKILGKTSYLAPLE